MNTDPGRLRDPLALLGRWRLSRRIHDRLSEQQSRIDGSLLIESVSPERLRWEERGRWIQPGGEVDVRRGLWLVRDAVQDPWWVRFEDDRAFHRWVPGEDVQHDCAPDTYRGVVSGSLARWTVRWDVTGPHKDYTMTTVLTPEG